MKGEEGIDFVQKALNQREETEINNAKLEKEIKAELDVLAMSEPEVAQELKNRILKKDTAIDEVFH